MCGIAGIIDVARPPTESAIERMIDAIPYRGPDGHGHICFANEGVALGHRRLSILDISDAAKQPMEAANGRFWITFNGEIYNYVEIREELVKLGHQFQTGSDTEVLLHAYQEWQRACLSRFIGMYAFAIWDRQERTLFAARDRLGIKPFYYRLSRDGLVFASEIKSILALEDSSNAVETSLIDAYMNFGYVPGEHTLYKGIVRLLPGHELMWRDGKVTVRSYWDLDFDNPAENDDIDTSADDVKRMLQDSIRLHLRSDVPLGVFLSGGIDSSAVVSLLSPNASSGLKTFSVAYDFGPAYDETPFAREVAARFATDHHEVRVQPHEFREFIPQFIWHMDEPVTEAAAISLYYVAKLAKQHVTVCLSGEGSDEIFAGYDFYIYNLAMERFRGLFGGSLKSLSAVAAKFSRAAKIAKYLRLASLPLEQRYRGISSYEGALQGGLYSSDFAEVARRGDERCAAFLESLFRRSERWDPLSRMLYFDTRTWLVDDLLIKADRMSMATSIELRVPFLDHRLVERAARIPAHHKIQGTETKKVLKHALRGLLPERIVKRKKLGFPTPLELMLRGELFDYANDTLTSQAALARGYFEPAAVRKLLADHRSGRAHNHREIWQLVVLEEWHRRFAS